MNGSQFNRTVIASIAGLGDEILSSRFPPPLKGPVSRHREITSHRAGGGFTAAVLSHHRTYGSVYGGAGSCSPPSVLAACANSSHNPSNRRPKAVLRGSFPDSASVSNAGSGNARRWPLLVRLHGNCAYRCSHRRYSARNVLISCIRAPVFRCVCSHENHPSNRRSCLCLSRDSVKNLKYSFLGDRLDLGGVAGSTKSLKLCCPTSRKKYLTSKPLLTYNT